MNKAHCDDFDNALDHEGNGENMAYLLNENVRWAIVFSIIIFITCHENGIDEDHQNNEIVEKWMAHELDGFVTNYVALVEAEA
jgi:hypothetical protein